MDLFEYQAHELFAAHHVPVLPSQVAAPPAEARAAAEHIGGPTVVKAQVQVGGRGKAGGIRMAETPAEAYAAAEDILGMDVKGHTVDKVMVAQAVDVAEEYYFSVLLDRAERSYLALCSTQGGMDIEQLAEEHPEALARVPVDPLTGIDAATARRIVAEAGFRDDVAAKVAPVLQRIYEVYHEEDATLVEVNPLVLTADGEILALDAKVTLDGNAAFRHDDRDNGSAHDYNYVKLDGSVGVIGNGAGLVMSTLDVVAAAGERHGGQRPANFLDVGGGASAEVMTASLERVLDDEQVTAVLVNVFGGITACDTVAEGIVGALREIGDAASKPIVVRLDGNSVEEGCRILADYDHPLLTLVSSMDDAADKVTELAASEQLAPVTT